jgi:pyruvate kinase
VNRVRREKEAITDAIAASVYEIAKQLKPRAIVTSTISGYTARNVSAERARVPIICVTPNENTYRRMSLVWGVTPIMIPQFNTIDEMLDLVVKACKKAGYVKPEDVLVVIAGIPFGIGGQTNFLKVHVVPMDV